ncbi:4'-phosphopantetheinyl transferase family protein [Lentzea aerocolonigenes]|uniref:4'-phosphopantetheinyl transferase family protein n=1 Tax=Lentzea aerocolonigenes TaxID=68170 RepID=UPI0004C3837E|nr:4'-phosphopantetheinyl transferase superfamily protein [Lentzea aerocolonigenes]
MRHRVAECDEVLGSSPVATADRQAAEGMPSWRAREFLAARTLLRGLLGDGLVADWAGTTIAKEPGGRPFLPDHPWIGVSLSHSGDWVAAAVGEHLRVGVDVEVPQRPVSPALLRRCCREQDTAAFEAMADDVRTAEFTWMWTAQEACVKAAGQGLCGRPWTVPVAVGQTSGSWGPVRWTALRGQAPVPVSCAWSEGSD